MAKVKAGDIDPADIAYCIEDELDRNRKIFNTIDIIVAKLYANHCKTSKTRVEVDNILIQYKPLGGGYDGNAYSVAEKEVLFAKLEQFLLSSFLGYVDVKVELKSFLKGTFITKIVFKKKRG